VDNSEWLGCFTKTSNIRVMAKLEAELTVD
jgi:hypothetical protein